MSCRTYLLSSVVGCPTPDGETGLTSSSSWEDIDCDRVVCGRCSATFPLADTLLFIKHKQEACGSVVSPENSQLLNDSVALEVNGNALKAHGNAFNSASTSRELLFQVFQAAFHSV